MLTFGFKQQWCSLHVPNIGFPKYVHSLRIAWATKKENLWNSPCQKLLSQFWNMFTVCLIFWDLLKHGCRGCFHISLLFLGWPPFECMPRVELFSMHNYVDMANIAKKIHSVFSNCSFFVHLTSLLKLMQILQKQNCVVGADFLPVIKRYSAIKISLFENSNCFQHYLAQMFLGLTLSRVCSSSCYLQGSKHGSFRLI